MMIKKKNKHIKEFGLKKKKKIVLVTLFFQAYFNGCMEFYFSDVTDVYRIHRQYQPVQDKINLIKTNHFAFFESLIQDLIKEL